MYIYFLIFFELFIIFLFYFNFIIFVPINIYYKLFYFDLFLFFIYIFYINNLNDTFNININNHKNRIFLLKDRYSRFYCEILDIKYKYLLGIKYNLNILISKYKNNLILTYNIHNIDNLKLHKKYYYDFMLNLLNKYSINFKKIDFFLINYIKDYLYK